MAVELTDVESVRQFMQKSLSDKLQDEDIEVLILQASEAIERHCNRQFVREGEGTRSFEFLPNTGLDLIDLKPYEFRSVQEVVLDPDLTPVVLVASQYRLWPYPSRDGTFFGLRLANLPEAKIPSPLPTTPVMPYQTRRVDVKATWGMATTPKGLQHWANVTVESWAHLRRDPGMGAGEAFTEGSPVRGYDLPPAAFYGLKRWTRPTPSA